MLSPLASGLIEGEKVRQRAGRGFSHSMGMFLLGILLVVGGRAVAQQNVELSWDPDQTGLVAGYRVFYGTESGVYTNSIVFGGPANVVELDGLQGGVTYYFAVQANDQQGDISPLSNEASYTVPIIEPVSLQMTMIPGTTLFFLSGNVVPAGSFELDESPDMINWTPIDIDAGSSVIYPVDMSAAPQMFFKVVR